MPNTPTASCRQKTFFSGHLIVEPSFHVFHRALERCSVPCIGRRQAVVHVQPQRRDARCDRPQALRCRTGLRVEARPQLRQLALRVFSLLPQRLRELGAHGGLGVCEPLRELRLEPHLGALQLASDLALERQSALVHGLQLLVHFSHEPVVHLLCGDQRHGLGLLRFAGLFLGTLQHREVVLPRRVRFRCLFCMRAQRRHRAVFSILRHRLKFGRRQRRLVVRALLGPHREGAVELVIAGLGRQQLRLPRADHGVNVTLRRFLRRY